jgi:hypothetical protein
VEQGGWLKQVLPGDLAVAQRDRKRHDDHARKRKIEIHEGFFHNVLKVQAF